MVEYKLQLRDWATAWTIRGSNTGRDGRPDRLRGPQTSCWRYNQTPCKRIEWEPLI
jgi:hypothetical protein